MKKCDDKTKLKRFLPASIEVAHKTGAPSARTPRPTPASSICLGGPVAVCVLTAQNEDKAWKDDNAANILIGRVAQQVQSSTFCQKQNEICRKKWENRRWITPLRAKYSAERRKREPAPERTPW